MLEKILRPYYQRFLVNDFAERIGNTVTPITLTFLGGLMGIAIIPALAYHYANLGIILLLMSGYLDTLDGTVARNQNRCTNFGSMLDILVDRCVEFSVIFGLFLLQPQTRALMCILMLGSILICITSFLVVGIFTPNNSDKSFHYSAGIIERVEAFVFFILMMLLPAYFTILASLFCGLVLLTTIIRIVEFSLSEVSFRY